MCFHSDIWSFLGEIDEESFHLRDHRWPRWGRQKEAAKNGLDGDDEGAMASRYTGRGEATKFDRDTNEGQTREMR